MKSKNVITILLLVLIFIVNTGCRYCWYFTDKLYDNIYNVGDALSWLLAVITLKINVRGIASLVTTFILFLVVGNIYDELTGIGEVFWNPAEYILLIITFISMLFEIWMLYKKEITNYYIKMKRSILIAVVLILTRIGSIYAQSANCTGSWQYIERISPWHDIDSTKTYPIINNETWTPNSWLLQNTNSGNLTYTQCGVIPAYQTFIQNRVSNQTGRIQTHRRSLRYIYTTTGNIDSTYYKVVDSFTNLIK